MKHEIADDIEMLVQFANEHAPKVYIDERNTNEILAAANSVEAYLATYSPKR